MRYSSKWPTYRDEWNRMVIKSGSLAMFNEQASFAVAHKSRYVEVEAATGVKWFHVAVIHRRESDANFNTYLGNGDPLSRRTTHVPAGRGPFSSFQAGAIDALRLDGLTSVQDWTLEKILYYCEIFNGTGYDMHGLPSPYIWGLTNIQRPGKYVADGEWNGSVWDTQPGCAPLLYAISKQDSTVQFVRESEGPIQPPGPPPHDAAWMQTELNTLGANPPLQVDGEVGPATIQAMIDYLSKQATA